MATSNSTPIYTSLTDVTVNIGSPRWFTRRDSSLTVRVAVAVVQLIAVGASRRRRGTTRDHAGSAAQSTGCGAERAADNRAHRTRCPIAARCPSRLARYRARYRVGISRRSHRLTDAAVVCVTRRTDI